MGRQTQPLFRHVVTLVVILASLQVSVWGQGSGSITGVVRDSTQAAIPSVAVKIVNTQSGVVTNIVTNETGSYRANSVSPGIYRIEASLPGFTTAVREATVSTGDVVAVDLILQVGQQEQSVNVVAEAPLTESQSSSVGQVVDHKY